MAMRPTLLLAAAAIGTTASLRAEPAIPAPKARQIEALDRGAVAAPARDGGVIVSWRLLTSDPAGASFDVLRDGKRLATVSGKGPTSLVDPQGDATHRYAVRLLGRKAGAMTLAGPYWRIPLDVPAGGTTPDGIAYTYTANDASVGDLDGDGRYDIALKWGPTNSHDNSQAGYTGPVLLDAYTLDGKRLWRINLGVNIRAGAHYTQFLVYDFDGDGRAEIAMKTADGTVDGTGQAIGDAHADWRSTGGEVPQADRTGAKLLPNGSKVALLAGRILTGSEYLTVFDGRTGRALATAPYDPPRYPGGNPTFQQLSDTWGDGYADRGNHQLSVADVDGDGRDEVIYGSMAVDDTGKGLWTDPLYHGDAMHVSDLDPSRPGLEKWGVHEQVGHNGGIGSALLDARTGAILWTKPAEHDTGRGLATDIDPRHVGAEMWGSNSRDLFDVHGNAIGPAPRQTNFAIWWDGDRLRELLDGTTISKWDWQAGRAVPLLQATDAASNNGTKANPALQADIFGDWREEMVLRSADNRELRIYETPFPTTHRYLTLMQDPVYRLGVAWQNTAYNQPPHTSFYLGEPTASDSAE